VLRTTAFKIDPAVFIPSVAILLCAVIVIGLFPERSALALDTLQAGIVGNASWFYVLVMGIVLLVVMVFALSRYGDIKLGPDHSQPAYGFVSWFAMLFAAGMGIGLMFFGVAEPVMHFLEPPIGPGGTKASASEAMRLTFFHWGLHAWAMYAAVALVLAYFAYRHALPLTLRSAFYPLIGEKIYGPQGAVVDVFAIVCTTCGLSTSLGYGVLQINAGLNYLFDVPVGVEVQVALILLTMLLAGVSVVLGLDTGIKRLSELNIGLSVLLLLGVLIAGPTILLLSTTVQNFGAYIAEVVPKTFNLYVYNPTDWLGGWTILYWGWWISWAPFVGIFVARISRGRTIREFVLGVTLVPSAFIFLWMGVFGGSAIDLIANQGAGELATAVREDQAVALFRFLDYLPGTEILSAICLAMIVIFFVTSADSGAMVLNMLSSGGEDNTPVAQRILWAVIIAAIASVLLLAGGLSAMQTAAIASALPFSFAVLGALWGFWRALVVDGAKRDMVSVHPPPQTDAAHWQHRLANLLVYPTDSGVQKFQREVVARAMKKFQEELAKHSIQATIQNTITGEGRLRLEVFHGDEIDFVYEVRSRSHPMPDESLSGKSLEDMTPDEIFYRAEVHLIEGGQDYDIMGWTEDQVLVDILTQYENHLHFLHTVR
jgi:choline/glycine/proline betaine transport protein